MKKSEVLEQVVSSVIDSIETSLKMSDLWTPELREAFESDGLRFSAMHVAANTYLDLSKHG